MVMNGRILKDWPKQLKLKAYLKILDTPERSFMLNKKTYEIRWEEVRGRYAFLPDEIFVPFENEEDAEVVPDEYYVGEQPPPLKKLSFVESGKPAYWFNCQHSRVMEYDPALIEIGMSVQRAWIPTDKVGKFVIDFELKIYIGEIRNKNLNYLVKKGPSLKSILRKASEVGNDLNELFD
jgi:hypothetical protein